jgi:hypothetical protein
VKCRVAGEVLYGRGPSPAELAARADVAAGQEAVGQPFRHHQIAAMEIRKRLSRA